MNPQVPRYRTGEEVCLGDRVTYAGTPDRVVFVTESNAFAPEFQDEYRKSLGSGFMIETEAYGPIYMNEADEHLDLVERQPPAADQAKAARWARARCRHAEWPLQAEAVE